jgi:hypothetical protein
VYISVDVVPTRTPRALVTGTGVELAGGIADGVLKREGEAALLPVLGVPQAPAVAAMTTTSASLPSDEALNRVPMSDALPPLRERSGRGEVTTVKGNDILRIGLRFRYDPAPEAGSPTLTPRASLEGVAVDGG